MQSHAALVALSQAWSDSIGLAFTFFILMPAIATVCIVVAIISGRGEKSADSKIAGRWGRRRPSDSD
jgi:NADH:ubiquinone oxidoreductase subunit K